MDEVFEKHPYFRNEEVAPNNTTALQIKSAVTKTGVDGIVEFLKNKSVEYINKADNLGNTALHHAAYNGNLELIELLLNHEADINCTPIETKEDTQKIESQWNIKQNSTDEIPSTPLYLAVSQGHVHVVDYLMEKGALKEIDNYDDKKGSSQILVERQINKRYLSQLQFAAAIRGHEKCLKLLLTRGIDFSYEDKKMKKSMVDAIFTNIIDPDSFLLHIFDQHIEKGVNTKYRIKIDFSILAPESKHQMKIINKILERDDEDDYIDLLQHPVIETYLKLKWAKISRFFKIEIALYLIFALSLSTHVLLLLDGTKNRTVIVITRYLIIITAVENFLHTFVRFLMLSKKCQSLLEILMNLACTALAFCISLADIQPDYHVTNTHNWVLHATSTAVLLAWFELMLLIGRLPNIGYYALMFTTVLEKVVKVLLTFSCLVIGFALSFSIQFHHMYQFNDPWLALVRTIVMMMGELEYSQLFNDIREEKSNFRLPATSRLIFLLFIVLVSIVLMNLMIGLAVSDIQGLSELGHVRRHLKQVEFLNNVENLVNISDNIRCVPKCLVKKMKSFITIKPVAYIGTLEKRYKTQAKLPSKYIDHLYRFVDKKQSANEIDDKIERILQIIRAELRKEM